MKKSIYLKFQFVPPESDYGAYVRLVLDGVHLALFDMPSIHFLSNFVEYCGLGDDYYFSFYVPQRGDGFTLDAYIFENGKKKIFPLDSDALFKYAESVIYAGSYPYDKDIPEFLRFVMLLMSDNQIKIAFPKLYGLFHNIKL